MYGSFLLYFAILQALSTTFVWDVYPSLEPGRGFAVEAMPLVDFDMVMKANTVREHAQSHIKERWDAKQQNATMQANTGVAIPGYAAPRAVNVTPTTKDNDDDDDSLFDRLKDKVEEKVDKAGKKARQAGSWVKQVAATVSDDTEALSDSFVAAVTNPAGFIKNGTQAIRIISQNPEGSVKAIVNSYKDSSANATSAQTTGSAIAMISTFAASAVNPALSVGLTVASVEKNLRQVDGALKHNKTVMVPSQGSSVVSSTGHTVLVASNAQPAASPAGQVSASSQPLLSEKSPSVAVPMQGQHVINAATINALAQAQPVAVQDTMQPMSSPSTDANDKTLLNSSNTVMPQPISA